MKNALLTTVCILISIGVTSGGAMTAHAISTNTETLTQVDGLITVQSENTFTETLDKAKTAIDARGFKVIAVIDHAAGAASADLTLRPTTLIIFGNPKGGTPVMQAAQTMGLVLPLKLLVFEDTNGVTHLAYNDMTAPFAQHGLSDLTMPQTRMNAALNAIAAQAAGPTAE